MNRPNSLSVDNLLRFLQLNRDGATIPELQRTLKLRKTDQRPLTRILANLKKRKAVVELPDGRFVLSSGRSGAHENSDPRQNERAKPNEQTAGGRNSLSGRLILHQDGYGFVVP